MPKADLTPDAAEWVAADMATGRFATPEDAVRYAVNVTKLAMLRDALKAAEDEGVTQPFTWQQRCP